MLQNYETFTKEQEAIIKKYVTNTSSQIFALRNLPEVIKGALFSRYSRSYLGLRSLLLKDFILNEETAFFSISNQIKEGKEDQSVAIEKAQNFYDRILDGYGDDSIGELGGAHLAIEHVSMIAAKAIEDCRIGGSPLEKSTRYIYFDRKYQGNYLFYREPMLMASSHCTLFVESCNHLFETYGKLVLSLTGQMENAFPYEGTTSKGAYTAALRAKVLDCLRGLLPAGTLTNMGLYGNGRFFETMIQKLHCHDLSEVKQIAKKSQKELSKVIPSFVRRSEHTHKYQRSFSAFCKQSNEKMRSLALKHQTKLHSFDQKEAVLLIDYDRQAPIKVGAALLFEHSQSSLFALQDLCRRLPKEELDRILEAASSCRENRRHKSPRALEHATFTFEITADFGVYRDLHRHRILTQERQLLSCSQGYFIPKEIVDTPMEKPYREAMDRAQNGYEAMQREFPQQAQYLIPMAYYVRWYFHINLRSLQWLCELRSSPAGHPSYRYIAQEMAKQVSSLFPEFERFFTFVDYEGYSLGRLGQEQRIMEKMGR